MVKRTLWLVIMACLGISLYTIVMERSHNIEEQVILGGSYGYAGSDQISYANPNAEPEVVDDGLNWPDIDITLPQYSIVNNSNLLSSAFVPDLAVKEDGETYDPIYGTKWQYFEASAKPHLDRMLKDMEALGFTPYIASSYRTYSYQSQLFNTKAFGLFMEMGYTNKDYDDYGTEEGTEVYNAYQLPNVPKRLQHLREQVNTSSALQLISGIRSVRVFPLIRF